MGCFTYKLNLSFKSLELVSGYYGDQHRRNARQKQISVERTSHGAWLHLWTFPKDGKERRAIWTGGFALGQTLLITHYYMIK